MSSKVILGVFRTQQKVEGGILAAAILVMAALTITNVTTRALLGLSWAVTEEIIQMLMIVVCFVGMSYAAGHARHIRMSAIHDLLARPARKLVEIFIAAGTMLLALLLTGFAIRYVYTVYELGAIYPATRIPYYVIYSVAPLGFLLTAVQYGLSLIQNLRDDRIHHSLTVLERSSLSARDESLAREAKGAEG